MTKRIVTAVTAAVVLTGLAWSQDLGERVLLRYKWNAGEQVTWRVTTEGGGDMLVQDLTKHPPQEQRINIFTVAYMPMYQTVEAVDEQRNGTVSYQMGPMEIDVQAAGQQQHMVMDPAANTMTVNGQQVPLPETMHAFLGQPMRMVMSPLGELIDYQVPFPFQQFFDMSQFSPGQFMQMSGNSQMQFPVEPVGVGYTWAQSSEIKLPTPAQQENVQQQPLEPLPITMTMVYTLAGFEMVEGAHCANIEMVGAMDMTEAMTMKPPAPGADMTVQVGPSHYSMRGVTYFDYEAGSVVRAEVTMGMNMQQETRGQVTHAGETHNIHTQMCFENFEFKVAITQEG